MSNKQSLAKSFVLILPKGQVAPHSFLFLCFNVLYFVPLLGGMLFSYSEGGTGSATGLGSDVATKITCIYLLGTLAFLCGSKLSSFIVSLGKRVTAQPALRLFGVDKSFWFVCFSTVSLFALSKFLIRGLGVYSDYAFETESMTGGVWSFSMFCSELLLLLSIIVLFSVTRHNVLWFLVLSGINGVNLLHGTRIFFVIGGIVFCFYLYVRRQLTFKMAILAFSGSLLLGYVIFLSRSRIETDDQTFSFARLISPIMYESIFSQLSLIGTINHPEAWSLTGSPHHFFVDALYFATPRFLLPGKDQLLFIDRFSDLSPLGAFSGYAHGLIYFGIFFPFFYLVLGIIAGWLQRHAKHSEFWSVIYVYFICDFLFRIMRDGYMIPVKMLLNALVIVLLFNCLRRSKALLKATFLPSHLRSSPQVGGG